MDPGRAGVGARPFRSVVEAAVNVAVAALGMWLGLRLFGGPGDSAGPGAVLGLTAGLFVVEVALRPVLRALAGRGSVLLALLIGMVGQVVVLVLVLRLGVGIGIERWPVALGILGTAAVVVSIGRWLVGANDAAYVVGHATSSLRPQRGPLRRRAHDPSTPAPQGLLVVQIDGLSSPVLERAVAAGQMPTLTRWLSSGGHQLRTWWATVPSTTPASQAAILYGDDRTVPSFRWWDRRTGGLLVSNRGADAAVIEGRLRADATLLNAGGVAVSTAFSGGADETYLVFSRSARRRDLGSGDVFVPLFASPFLLPRTLILSAGEVIKELFQARRQRTRDVQPRIRRALSYVGLRAITNVMLRTVNLVVVADRMSRGAPIIFVDFVDYDEIAHHAGPERPEAMRALEGLDGVLGELESVARRVPTAYEIVVWSDHGQSLGSTFEQLTGRTLADLVRELMAQRDLRLVHAAGGDDWGPLNALIAGSVRTTRRRAGPLVMGPDRSGGSGQIPGRRGAGTTPDGAVPDLVVVGGGNLGMIWFPELDRRPTLATIDERWPLLVPGLALSEGIGAVMVATGPGEAVAVGPAGTRRIGGPQDGLIEGTDPLEPYGRNGVMDLHRLTALEDCGDLVVLSTVGALGMVHAFEGQVGSHGGLGGPQNLAIFIHPSGLPLDEDLFPRGVVPRGAVAINEQLRRWRARQGTLDQPVEMS